VREIALHHQARAAINIDAVGVAVGVAGFGVAAGDGCAGGFVGVVLQPNIKAAIDNTISQMLNF
jgi:hypothetical protein